MTALLPPTLAEIGQALWGTNWAQPLADNLKLATDEVVALDTYSDEIPPEMTEQIIAMCRLRIEEIESYLERLKLAAPSPVD